MRAPNTNTVVALIAASAVAACSPSGEDPNPSAPDLILYNGKIVTVDADFSYAEAVSIEGDRFSAVGTDEAMLALADTETQLIDLEGRTVVPGLMDNHLHAIGGGPGVDLSRVRTLSEALAAIAARVTESAPGELVITNSDWHEAQLAEQRLPLRFDLDSVAPDNPVIVVRGGHEYVLNSAALERWDIDESTAVPLGGQISRYDNGRLNGELIDRAKDLVELPAPPQLSLEERIDQRKDEYARLHAVGLTSVRHPGGPIEEYELLKEMKRRGVLTMRITHLLRPRGLSRPEEIRELLETSGVSPWEGDALLKNGGIKLAVDGGFEGGWMRVPYAEPWDQGGQYRGINTMPYETFAPVVRELNRHGWSVSTHAVGDAAMDLVLRVYEEANDEISISGRRWTIEHGFIAADDHFARLRDLDVLVAAQNHLYVAGPSLEKYWGRERAEWTTPMRRYLDEGIRVSGGTDAPVVPYPPLWAIYHFVTRDTITGGVYGESQRISREEALRLFTIDNAYLTFEEDIKGSIEPGKLADLVVLADDIMTCPAECIRDTRVLLTMVGGQIVFLDSDLSR